MGLFSCGRSPSGVTPVKPSRATGSYSERQQAFSNPFMSRALPIAIPSSFSFRRNDGACGQFFYSSRTDRCDILCFHYPDSRFALALTSTRYHFMSTVCHRFFAHMVLLWQLLKHCCTCHTVCKQALDRYLTRSRSLNLCRTHLRVPETRFTTGSSKS